MKNHFRPLTKAEIFFGPKFSFDHTNHASPFLSNSFDPQSNSLANPGIQVSVPNASLVNQSNISSESGSYFFESLTKYKSEIFGLGVILFIGYILYKNAKKEEERGKKNNDFL